MEQLKQKPMRPKYLATLITILLVACDNSNDDSTPVTNVICNEATGLVAPLPVCSSTTPCTRVASELNVSEITTPVDTPECDSSVWDERLSQNVLGFTRHACIRRPAGASSSSTRPLVLWFHPGGNGSADLAATETDLINKSNAFDLTDDPNRPGFILVSVQGRNLRFPTAAPRDGHHHDFYFRDTDSPSTNPDIANADQLIDNIVQEGIVDTDRIYVMGWSNGAFFSQLYAIARNVTPTADGNVIAAASVFSAASPFGDISWDPFNEEVYTDNPSCSISTLDSDVPILIVYRTSDAAVACDAQQAMCFDTEPGYTTDAWISQATQAGLNVNGILLGGLESNTPVPLDAIATACTDYSNICPIGNCSNNPFGDNCLSIVNHARWPDGVYNNGGASGIDREIEMLEFLRNNPLP